MAAEPELLDVMEQRIHGMLAPKRLAQLFAGALVISTIAGAILWRIYVHAPPADEVCAHKMQLILSESSRDQAGSDAVPALLERLQEQCISGAQRKTQLDGKMVYASYARCIMAAATLNQAERC